MSTIIKSHLRNISRCYQLAAKYNNSSRYSTFFVFLARDDLLKTRRTDRNSGLLLICPVELAQNTCSLARSAQTRVEKKNFLIGSEICIHAGLVADILIPCRF